MKGVYVAGIALLLLSFIILLFQFRTFASILSLLLAVISWGTSLLSGRKIAYLNHDSRILRERGKHVYPTRGIFLWFSLWLLFLVVYSIFNIMFFKIGVSLFFSSLTGAYWGMGMMLTALIGSYLLFYSISQAHPDKLYTRWGKIAVTTSRATSYPLQKATQVMEEINRKKGL